MEIDVVEMKHVTVVTPHADIDMAAATTVKRRLTELIDQGRARLVIDMGRVGYIDSSGLGAIVAVMKHARAASGDIKICALQKDVSSVFEMTRLTKVMSIHPTRQAAIAAWG
jgi:anti-sigma B factor antagonist